MNGVVPEIEIAAPEVVLTHWDVLAVGDPAATLARLEASGLSPNANLRGRTLRMTHAADQEAALQQLAQGSFQVVIVGPMEGSAQALCERLRTAGLPTLRIVVCHEMAAGFDATAIDALDVDLCPCSEPEVLRAMTRAALRYADDLAALDLARAEALRQMTIRERLEGIAAMVTGITHDVSTPLGVACTAGSVVDETARRMLKGTLRDDNERAELSEDMRDALDILTRSLDRARRLIDSFKQFSSSQFSNERAKVQLTDVITDCVMVLRSELRRARISLEVHAPPDEDLRWDGFPGHLGRVLVNLLQNSMRYAFDPGQGGKVSIHLDRTVAGDAFVMQYIDDGKGIEPATLPRIFDAFFTTGRSTGGTGLGLAISHNIVVNLLGGTIRCDSTLGEGTTFTITLPAVATGDGGQYVNGLQDILPGARTGS